MQVRLVMSLAWLAVLHVAVIGAEFVAPYDAAEQNRDIPFAPPVRVHFADGHGWSYWRPFVCLWVARSDVSSGYVEDCSRRFPLRLFTSGARYKFAGIETRRHLFGVDKPGVIDLLGTDQYGRDQLSRFLHGGQVSLLAGVLACVISLGAGLLLGITAGFYGGWIDETIMSVSQLFLGLPWLYLLFAVRAFLPLHLGPFAAFLLIVTLIGFLGWARPALLIRGVVLSARERGYVIAARGFGASDLYILRRHVLPQTMGVATTQASILIPKYILAEVTLSFLGLGVNEPAASWGNMLSALLQYHVLISYWWMFLPVLALVPTFLAYLTLSNGNQTE